MSPQLTRADRIALRVLIVFVALTVAAGVWLRFRSPSPATVASAVTPELPSSYRVICQPAVRNDVLGVTLDSGEVAYAEIRPGSAAVYVENPLGQPILFTPPPASACTVHKIIASVNPRGRL